MTAHRLPRSGLVNEERFSLGGAAHKSLHEKLLCWNPRRSAKNVLG